MDIIKSDRQQMGVCVNISFIYLCLYKSLFFDCGNLVFTQKPTKLPGEKRCARNLDRLNTLAAFRIPAQVAGTREYGRLADRLAELTVCANCMCMRFTRREVMRDRKIS